MTSIIFCGISIVLLDPYAFLARRICQMQEICNSACEELDTERAFLLLLLLLLQHCLSFDLLAFLVPGCILRIHSGEIF